MEKKEIENLCQAWYDEFYSKYSEEEILQDQDFESVAFGFFIAKGKTPEEAKELYGYCIQLEMY